MPGPPVSQQARRKSRREEWKEAVRAKAAGLWLPALPEINGPLGLKIGYFYSGEIVLDTDNMIKPIQDALIGLVYIDDDLISDVVARRRPLDGSLRIPVMTPALTEGFGSGREFLHIVVDRSDPEEYS